MSDVKDIQKLYETTVLTGQSKALEESRGGWMIGTLEELESAFNSDAVFYNGKYSFDTEINPPKQTKPMLSEKEHKSLIRALKGLSSAIQKSYKGKLIGF